MEVSRLVLGGKKKKARNRQGILFLIQAKASELWFWTMGI